MSSDTEGAVGMRKDVKLGLIVCGTLLAVLVIYVLSGTGGSSPKELADPTAPAAPTGEPITTTPRTAELAQGTGTGAGTLTSGGGATTQPLTGGQGLVITGTGTQGSGSTTITSIGGPSTGTPAPDPFEAARNTATTNPADLTTGGTGAIASSNSGSNVDWNRMLETGQVTTISPPAGTGTMGSTGSRPLIPTGGTGTSGTGTVDLTGPGTGTSGLLPPPTGTLGSSGSIAAGARTHTVRYGETLSSIAQAAYGDASLYTIIQKANPSVDPKKLKVGIVLNMPDASAVKAGHTIAPSNTGTTGAAPMGSQIAIDPAKEYKVQPGDTLEKIAVKLYGRMDRWEKIYEANKSRIGSDPHKIKSEMVLVLPESPTR